MITNRYLFSVHCPFDLLENMSMSNGMLGKTISLDENDGQVATTSSQPTEESTSIVQGNSENSTGPQSPAEILPDQVNRNESDNDRFEQCTIISSLYCRNTAVERRDQAKNSEQNSAAPKKESRRKDKRITERTR